MIARNSTSEQQRDASTNSEASNDAAVDRKKGKSNAFFLRQFISRPGKVGAFAPSSGYLANAMIGDYDLANASSILELGPGTGAVTKYILKQMGPKTQFHAIELSEEFVLHLKEEFPQLNVHQGSATESLDILKQNGLQQAEYIISGLPWAAFEPELQKALMAAVMECLPIGGRFTTFAYSAACWLPKGTRFRKLLEQNFSQVNKTRVVWRNLPPAFAYQCVK